MPRRRGPSDTTATRHRIVAAAAAVFAQEGYAGSSTRQLAGAADLNISTLAHHFGNKQGLYLAVLDACCAELLAFPTPSELPAARADRVRHVMTCIYRFAREHRKAVVILLRHELEHRSLPAPIRERWTERSFERLAALQAALPGVPLLSRPRSLLTLRHLVAQYAVSDVGGAVQSEGDEALARHLGEVSVRLLVD